MLTPDQEMETLSSTTDGLWRAEAVALAKSLGVDATAEKDDEGYFVNVGPYEVQQWFDHHWAVNVQGKASVSCGSLEMAVRIAASLMMLDAAQALRVAIAKAKGI